MSNLDMSLDDMIKQNKKSRASNSDNQSRSRSRNSGPGPSRRLPNRASNRSTPYGAQKVEAPDTTWGHDMYEGHGAAHPARSNRGSFGIETGTKLLITNLDYGVSNEDIKELFAEVGDMKRAMVHYDRSGRSKGTAEVVFSRRRDAEMAIKKYDHVQLDGKPMKLELVGTNMGNNGGGAVPNAAGMMYGNQSVAPRRGGVMGRLRGGARTMRPQGGGGGGGGRGRGRGRGGERGEKVSAKDLDADLEKYHAGAMQTD
uniref:THO complex subunit 4A-like isoform X2 n=1 Tax=Erigeron canadensis TaxID=72917 RepID=UPI001CB8C6E9|nr:THO complex subunit 4A-like isoform X2 [Erigeron canadensis]